MKTVSVFVALALAVVGCGGSSGPPAASKSVPTAKVDNPKPESDLATVTLSPEAQKHLAIQTMKVTNEPVSLTRTVGGETIVPPGKSVAVTAPIAGTLTAGRAAAIGPVRRGDVIFELVPLQQSERDVRAEAERAVQEAEARLTQTTQRAQRLEQLLKEGSASARSVEEAQADRAVAAAAADAARKRLESVSRLPVGPRGEMALRAPFDGLITELRAAAGQTVAAGAPVADLAQTSALWIRAPVYVGDLSSLDTSQPALVASLGQETSGPWRQVRRVTGPPAANPAAASVDLFFEVTSTGRLRGASASSAAALAEASGIAMRPGERLAVRLPLKATDRALVVPQSAVVYDVNGGVWVYEQRAPNQFARRRVELGGPAGTNVIVTRGLAEGVTVVSVGAAELYGTEFYVNK
ncbi:MAG TPA: efflux RND transporter periplasmic adaptor subunit [Vicinamibacterales bacterium]|nr:efflux RND transporter periplasmic adaptor subunit [Vicinamibacterales bacterium]